MTTIGKGTTIRGNVFCEEPVSIAGTINGDVHASNHDVTLERGARVDGAITGRTITIRGHSSGKLIAREIVHVERTGHVKGDIASPMFALDDGGYFHGSVTPGRVDAALIVAAYRSRNEPSRTA